MEHESYVDVIHSSKDKNSDLIQHKVWLKEGSDVLVYRNSFSFE